MRDIGTFGPNDDEFSARIVGGVGEAQEIGAFPIYPHVPRPAGEPMIDADIDQGREVCPFREAGRVDGVEKCRGCTIADAA